jgi:hypothetical protein
MRKLAIIAVLAISGWQLYESRERAPVLELTRSSQAAESMASAAPQFSCDGRQHCSKMHSRAEAEFFIQNCPNTKMDGDNDGEPCENDSRF